MPVDDPSGSRLAAHTTTRHQTPPAPTPTPPLTLCPRWDFDEFMAVPGCVVAEHEPVVWDN